MNRGFLIWAGLFFLFANPLFSQFNEKPIINLQNEDKAFLNWGYYLGFNVFDFKLDYKNDLEPILIDPAVGFNVGLIGEMRINNHLDLRFEPGLFYSQRSLGFFGMVLMRFMNCLAARAA